MRRSTTAIITATEITRTGYFYKCACSHRSIDRSLRPTGRMPWTQDAEATKQSHCSFDFKNLAR